MKAAVIGSGIAGLATAIRLANKNYKVVVYESKHDFGGKLSSIESKGYRFDAGPSLFTMPWLVEEVLNLPCGRTDIKIPYKRLDTLCHYFYPDGTFLKAAADEKTLAADIAHVLNESESSVLSHLKKSSDIYKITAPVFLERSLHKATTYLRPQGLYGILNLWRIQMFRSMNSANTRKFKNPKTTQLFNRYATYNGSNPYKAPATLNVIPHLETHFGAYFPEKGMRNIVETLYEKALSCGVEFKFNSPVASITTENKRIKAVTTQDGQSLPYDVVVSNSDARKTYNKLLKMDVPGKIANAENSSSAIIFYWGIKREFENLDVHNIIFSENYQREFEDIFENKTIGNDLTVYIHISSKVKKEDAPEGCENWFVMVNAPADYGQDWSMLRQKARLAIINKVNKALGVQIEDFIETEEILDPTLIELRTGSDKGSLYGSSSNNMMSAFFRQANFSSAIKGLYFCGGSVHPGGGIPLCMLGAKIVGDLIPKAGS